MLLCLWLSAAESRAMFFFLHDGLGLSGLLDPVHGIGPHGFGDQSLEVLLIARTEGAVGSSHRAEVSGGPSPPSAS